MHSTDSDGSHTGDAGATNTGVDDTVSNPDGNDQTGRANNQATTANPVGNDVATFGSKSAAADSNGDLGSDVTTSISSTEDGIESITSKEATAVADDGSGVVETETDAEVVTILTETVTDAETLSTVGKIKPGKWSMLCVAYP